jgi:MFS family permease
VYAVMAVYAVAMGLSYGGIVSLLPALCMDYFGARAVSSIIGTLYTGAAFGNLAGPWLAGRLFDVQGNYTTVALVCLAFGAVAAGCAGRMRKEG